MSFFDKIRELFGHCERKEEYSTVEVKKGDSMWGIANEITGDGERWQELANINPGHDAHHTIQPGEKLNIPNEWVDE